MNERTPENQGNPGNAGNAGQNQAQHDARPDAQHHEPSRWHILADGSVILSYPKALDYVHVRRSRSKGSQHAQPQGMNYFRYTATRRLELADLDSLDGALARFDRSLSRVTKVLFPLFWAGLGGVVLSWLVLSPLGVDSKVTSVLFTLSLPLVLLGALSTVVLPRVMRRRIERIHVDGGFASSTPEVLKEPAARELIDASGTVSGPSARAGQGR